MGSVHIWQRRMIAAALGVCLGLSPAAVSAGDGHEQQKPSSGQPAKAAPARPPAGKPTPAAGEQATPPARKPAAPPREPAFSIHGLVDFGHQTFAAKDSFDAVLGKTGGPIFGGGVRVGHRSGIFGQITVSRFTADGERVFVFDNEVFPLGIPVEVQATPIDVSFGYRYIRRPKPARTPPAQPRPGASATPPGASRPAKPAPPAAQPGQPGQPARAAAPQPARRQTIFPFVGGGFGRFGYKETAEFAEPGDDVDESFTSYHVMGGVDIALMRWLGVGVEAKYRWVPDGLGENGVSKEFGQTDLGGFVIVGRVTIGR